MVYYIPYVPSLLDKQFSSDVLSEFQEAWVIQDKFYFVESKDFLGARIQS